MVSRPRRLTKLVCLTLLALVATEGLRAENPFTDMVVFGASFSRSTNRQTNGMVWNEFLASQLGIPAAATSNTNYAAGGNTSIQMKSQVTTYLDQHSPTDSTLVTFGLIANDFIGGPGDAVASATNLTGLVRDLADAGAQHFVIPIQTLGSSPNVRSRGEQGFDTFFEAVESELSTSLPALESESGITIYRPDWVSVFDAITANPASYGFTDILAGDGQRSPIPHEILWWDGWHPTTSAHRLLGDAAFRTLGVTPSVNPVEVNNEAYQQDFTELGPRSAINIPLPVGWAGVTDGAVYTSLTGDFPRKVGVGGALYNVGIPDDRALAIGNTSNAEQYELQLHTRINDAQHSALQLQFDIEAWAINEALAEVPGEAAFEVTVEQKQGDTYVAIAEFGTVTTGATLTNRRSRVDGEAEANHTSFSGTTAIDVTAGSDFRIRWRTPLDRPTMGWSFGLDNVRLYFPRVGDANQDGKVDFPDFLLLSANFGQNGGWEQGDFNSDGEVSFPDFLILSSNFEAGSNATVHTVPEPTDRCLALLSVLGTIAFLRRR